VQLCRFDQRSNTRPVDRALIVAGKKAVFAIECYQPFILPMSGRK
jgi:hypothetical protein